MTWLPRRILADCRGVIAVEFALLLPTLLILFFGAVEIARVQVTCSQLDKMVYDLAYDARISTGEKSPQALLAQHVEKKLPPLLSPEDITVTVTSAKTFDLLQSSPAEGAGSDGDCVKLEVSANVGLMSWLLPEELQSKKSFVMYYINEATSYRSLAQ